MNRNESSVDAGRRHYYSSSHGPFYNANNILMFYGGGERGEVVENVIQSLETGGQVIHVSGEPGSGKTMLSLVISDKLKHQYNSVRYDVPELSRSLLLRHLLIEICPQNADLITAETAQAGANPIAMDRAFNAIVNQLVEQRSGPSGKPYLLILDSKCSVSSEVVRLANRLAGIVSRGEQIMQFLIFHRTGGDSPDAPDASDVLRRSDSSFWLRRLTLGEVNEYLHHHMLLFDFNRRNVFTREMGYFIADRSEGVFRSINTLARNAMTIANLENAEKLTMSHLLTAGLPLRSKKSTGSGFVVRHRGRVVALLGSCVVASALVAAIFFR